MKTFVVGDIHGNLKALNQVLERSGFDNDTDKLICLGDVADGLPDAFECIEKLMTIKNLVYIMGNHDYWLLGWLEMGQSPAIWTEQGGRATLKSYMKYSPTEWAIHRKWLAKGLKYFVDDKNRCFVHAGVSQKGTPIEECDKDFLCWDRDLFYNRHNLKNVKPFKEIFVGHTEVWNLSHHPLHHGNVWFIDTGAGWKGKLSMMNVDTKEVFQSDVVSELYLNYQPRQ